MKTSILAFCSVATVCALSASAFADDWTPTVSFQRSDVSSIRITEPEGYAVSVVVDGTETKDTVPANIRVPQADGFYNVTLTSPKGATWTKKIEVKRYNITQLTVKHVPAAAGAPQPAAAAVRQYIGSVRNQLKTCGKAYTAKLEFIDAAGGAGPVVQVDSGKLGQAQIPGGAWDARAYIWESDQWTYQTTQKVNINSDNWSAKLGCPNNGAFQIEFK